MEAKCNLASLPLDGGDAQTLTHRFEDGVLQKVIHGGRRRAEAIFELLSNVGPFFVGGNGGDALVGAQAEIFAGDVIMRNAHVEAEAKGSAEIGSGLFALQLGNCALEHLTVEVEADGFDVAVLLAAEHVACAAQLEVERGDAEASAEFAELFHGGETFTRDVGERRLRRDQKIGVSALVGAANATAELVQLGEAEAVG